MKENKLRKTVMVGMSGGVDSSVAASILLDQGYEVTGVTLKLLESEDVPCCADPSEGCCADPTPGCCSDQDGGSSCVDSNDGAGAGATPGCCSDQDNESSCVDSNVGADVGAGAGASSTKQSKTCCSLDDVEDARATAFKLGIPFYVLNMKAEFKEKVIDYFIDSYLDGETPNPCIYCNKFLKFEGLLKKAYALDIDHIATGHYARREFDEATGKYVLKKALDPSKDQSYALYMLTQDQLSHLLLPLGNLSKTEIRAMAEQKELKVFNKPDSQDICFVNEGEYPDYIKRHSSKKILPGNFVDKDGNILGRHKGIIYYTVGQRKGLGIAWKEPLYVLAKDVEKNTILLGNKDTIKKSSLIAREMNYISISEPTEIFKALAKVRYSSKETEVTVTPLAHGRALVEFLEPQAFIAPGQAVVLYDGDVVIGGGIIEKEPLK
jgi:tRNA-uridine 2-sulfurtransferase